MKLNLISFHKRHLKKISFFFGLLLTYLFIRIYRFIPQDDNFEFVIYSLAILYSFLFYITATIESIFSKSIELNYETYKDRYISCKRIYDMHFAFMYCADYEKNQVSLQSLTKLNIRTMIKERYKDNPPIEVMNSITYSKIYICFENYITRKHFVPNSYYENFLKNVYIIWNKQIDKSFKSSLIAVEKIFGNRLNSDISNDQIDKRNWDDLIESIVILQDRLDYVIDSIEQLKFNIDSNQELVCSKIDTLEEKIVFEDDSSLVIEKLYEIEEKLDNK